MVVLALWLAITRAGIIWHLVIHVTLTIDRFRRISVRWLLIAIAIVGPLIGWRITIALIIAVFPSITPPLIAPFGCGGSGCNAQNAKADRARDERTIAAATPVDLMGHV